MENARRIRQLAGRNLAPEVIAARLKLRPAVVRRVLGRSAKRGAPRKRSSSTTLSFVTTLDVADRIRAAAKARGAPVSTVVEELVRKALPELMATTDADSSTTTSSTGRASLRSETHLVGHRRSSAGRARAGDSEAVAWPAESENKRERSRPAKMPVTAADAPASVRRLLKSYEPSALRWKVAGHRYAILVAILTRGDDHARRWLWTLLSRREARDLVRKYRGAGYAEPDRSLLREQLELTTADLPSRPFLGFGREGMNGREHP
jgi:hypothetical protein